MDEIAAKSISSNWPGIGGIGAIGANAPSPTYEKPVIDGRSIMLDYELHAGRMPPHGPYASLVAVGLRE